MALLSASAMERTEIRAWINTDSNLLLWLKLVYTNRNQWPFARGGEVDKQQ